MKYLLFGLVIFLGCAEPEVKPALDLSRFKDNQPLATFPNESADSTQGPDTPPLVQGSPLDFLRRVRTDNAPVDSIMNTFWAIFPKGFVRREHIDSLMLFIGADNGCRCFLSPYSSTIPRRQHADLGGWAIQLIESFKDNKTVTGGLVDCPTTTEERVSAIHNWWEKIR